MALTDPSRPPTPLDPTSLPVIDLGNEGVVDLDDLPPADDEVPLAQFLEPPSGQSLTSWTEVIRRQRAAARGPAGPVRVDAPSDKDILTRVASGPGHPAGSSESDIDLDRPAAAGTGESAVKFDVLFPPEDAAGAMPAPPRPEDVLFAAAVEPDGSGVNLGADTGPAGEDGRSSILDVLLQDTGNARHHDGDGIFDADHGSVRYSRPVPSSAEREITDADLADSRPGLGSDDAVDLTSDPAPGPSLTDSGTLEISAEALEESQRRAEAEQSSSIDLSSRPSFPASDFDVDLDALARTGTDSDIDLNLPAAEDEANASLVHRNAALDHNSAALAAAIEARRQGRDLDPTAGAIVPARGDRPVRSGGYLIHGGIIGLLLGAGGVLAAYFGGVLPNRQPVPAAAAAVEPSADLARLRQDVQTARQEADADRQLADLKAAADTAAADARTAQTAAAAVQTELAMARKETADARTAQKEAANTLANLTTTLTTAGLDATKPADGIQKLTAARAAAEAAAKDADARLATLTKKVEDLTALADTAKKAADDATKAAAAAVKARDANAATLQAIADRLARAKLVDEPADAAAVLRGIDAAVQASRPDATTTLRDELLHLRTVLKATSDRAATAEREASAARTAAERSTAEARRLRALNDRLAGDLAAVQDLAALINDPNATGPSAKPDPVRLSEQFFGNGVRAFLDGRYPEAETALRKAVQFRPADARYHYWLGLALRGQNRWAAAAAAFEKGRDLELAGRPSSRAVSAALERVQGPARQAVDAYRP